MDRARLERQMRELALEHAAARVDDAAYLGRMAACGNKSTRSRRNKPTTCRPTKRSRGWTRSPRPGIALIYRRSSQT